MELYFNPYPGAVPTIEEGARLIVDVADALIRLKRELQNVQLSEGFADFEKSPSDFIVVKDENGYFRTRDFFSVLKTSAERDKIKLLLNAFSKGRTLSFSDMKGIDDWVVKNIGASAPILELAVKNNAIALTIPTESEWRIDQIEFKDRAEFLHNLWGQRDLAQLKAHCVDAITNLHERFSVRYDAVFCEGALNTAPEYSFWESFGFFQNMDKAKERLYEVDGDLIKNVGHTEYGTLCELRCYGFGWRIFFVYRKDVMPKILIGGFYQKNGGVDQNVAIQRACERIHRMKILQSNRCE